jgi:hypothetical protein
MPPPLTHSRNAKDIGLSLMTISVIKESMKVVFADPERIIVQYCLDCAFGKNSFVFNLSKPCRRSFNIIGKNPQKNTILII